MNTTKLPTFFVSHGDHPLATPGDPGNFHMPAGSAQANKIVFSNGLGDPKCSQEKFLKKGPIT
jgi:hypothetical protein